ncbi:two-component regulator propeller domain-containing protein [Pedobacter sp. NJ-S-72]
MCISGKHGLVTEKLNLGRDLTNTNRVNSIYQDRMKNIWIATSGGLLLYERRTDKVYNLQGSNYGLRSNVFLSVIQDNQHQLFVGLQDGGLYKADLSHLDQSKPTAIIFEQLKYENGFNIIPRSVPELFLDKEENLWVGTYGDGVFMLSRTPDKFKAFHKKLKDNDGENYVRYYGMCVY